MASRPPILRDGRVLAVGAALSLLCLVLALSPSSSDPESLGTSLDYGFAGHRALYEFLDESGHNPQRFRLSPRALGEREGTLWMIRPNDELLANHQEALFALGEWVEGGNHVILVMGDSQLHPLWLQEILDTLDEPGEVEGDEGGGSPQGDDASPSPSLSPSPSQDAPPPSGLVLLSEGLGVPLARRIEGGGEIIGRGALEAPDGIQAETTLEGFEPLRVPFGAEVLWSLEGEPVILRSAVGEGTVTWVENGELAANAHIGEGDHAWLLEGLMIEDGPVYFDEFFHGLPEYQALGDVLLRPPLRIVTLQALLLLGMILWYLVPRFGAPRDPAPKSRRQKREHIEAMASLLARADDGSFLVQETSAHILADVRQRLGLSPQTSEALIIDGLRARRPEVAQSLQLLLADGRAHTLRGNRASLLAWGRRADTLRSTLQEVKH